MAQFYDFIAPTRSEAIHNYIAFKFGRWDEKNNYIEPVFATVQGWALDAVQQLAADQENDIDKLINGNPVRMLMLNIEIVDYANAGRPADPAPARYVIANAMAARRGITLRAMLETLLARWRDVQQQVATLITQLDAATEAIEAATTIAEVEAVLAGLSLH